MLKVLLYAAKPTCNYCYPKKINPNFMFIRLTGNKIISVVTTEKLCLHPG
jgi:hypothetical protein